MTLDTVAVETPAARATSLTVTPFENSPHLCIRLHRHCITKKRMLQVNVFGQIKRQTRLCVCLFESFRSTVPSVSQGILPRIEQALLRLRPSVYSDPWK